ncbi:MULTISPECIES: oligopeptide:H+ symporter [Caulobacter]|jgi:POT family proton-dependent oligopeptide transporter|uniref:Amino acid/peptide transporter (Peptide:H symporter) n=1 Tax=Caulobacter vibrioides OR37 TaxID=1292034 RepID=R0EGJ1_CAUVI|nr:MULTISPECIES: oligopeptide:H+ symporter [Caulobacter]ENZ80397.1 amino acid/peptide transporter (peptide:H symporter) [Caulobacter vibrioides OR37]MBQ1562893.1 MFS transporter [Caulobacter sp.]
MNVVIAAGILVTLVTGVPVLVQLLRGHPRGLIICFLAEMWERFSYYGMRGLLIFYLTQHFLFDSKVASGHYGSYTSLVYIVPLLGGFLADRYLGTRKAVAFGAILLVAGHLAMAIEGPPATQTLTYGGHAYAFQAEGRGEERVAKMVVAGKPYAVKATETGDFEIKDLPAGAGLPSVLPKGQYKLDVKDRDPTYLNIFWLALSLIIVGVGFMKSNVAALVGQLYPQGDPRRDPGFTLYYYGINLGSFWAAILCGILGVNIGWWAGFGAAGLGMLAGFVIFVLGKPWLLGKGEPPADAKLKERVAGHVTREVVIYGVSLLAVAAVFLLVQYTPVVRGALIAGMFGSLAYILWFAFAKVDKVERERLLLVTVLVLGAVVFWTLFEQAGSSLNLFAATNVDLLLLSKPAEWFGGAVVLGAPSQLAAAGISTAGRLWINTDLNAAQTQAIQAGWILIYAPVFAAMWTVLTRKGVNPSPMIKFGLSLIQVGGGFLVLLLGAQFAGPTFKMPLIFLVVMYMLHTTGELFMSPVGLSQMTKLSPLRIVSFVMAVWYMALAMANLFGGWIAAIASTETIAGQVLNPGAAMAQALLVFKVIGLAAIGIGVLFLLLAPVLKKWSHGADDVDAGPIADSTVSGQA